MSRVVVNELVSTNAEAARDVAPVAAAAIGVPEAGQTSVSAPETAPQAGVPFEHRMATKNDLAACFGVDVRTIENWQRDRPIPYIKIGGTVRFKMGDVVRHVAKHFTFATPHS